MATGNKMRYLFFVAVPILAAAIVLGSFSVLPDRSSAALYRIVVDGEQLGITADRPGVENFVRALEEEARASVGVPVKRSSVLSMERVVAGPEITPADQLQGLLRQKLVFLADAYIVRVNGQDVVGVASEQEGRKVIEEIEAVYRDKSASRGTGVKIDEVRISEQIEIVPKTLEVGQIRTRDEARRILLRGTDKIVIHTVQRGQSLWQIANANKMSVDDLRKANPELTNPDRLQIGQQLNLVVADPYVNVVTRETLTFVQAIPFPVRVEEDPDLWPWQREVKQAGQPGKKEVTLQVERVNGNKVAEHVLQEKILSEPTLQIVVQGTKIVPRYGTGQFAWPAVGTVTSRFGYRWRDYHQGIDIAGPVGTPVMAADSGMVVFAGRKGNYGLTLIIDHGEGKYVTLYGHLSTLLVNVGDRVERGQVIAKMGNTGRSTGPHLHFEIRVDGRAVDPIRYYPG